LSPVSTLISNFDRQDDHFSSAFTILREAIEERAFPAGSIAVTHQNKLVALKSFGKFVYEEDAMGGDFESANKTPSTSTLFDLASLTKVIATTTMAMILHERGLLELDGPVIGTVPEFLGNSDPRRHDVTFRMLLAHSSGLPAYEKLFLKTRSRDELLNAALTMPLSADPGTHAEYSDVGFIVLGVALERLAEECLDVFCQREVFGPLGMSNTTFTTFNPPPDLRSKIPPTADEREDPCGADTPVRQRSITPQQPSASQQKPHSTFRNRIIQGEVQDENAYVLGGVAPHAGLFSTAEDIASFAFAMMHRGSPILHPETVALFTRRDTTPGTSRALGWDTPFAPSASGKYFGQNSFGHLGYTGTSLWIDPDRELSITLLTNRTWPDCSNLSIKQVRPRFHDAVIESLEKPR
jgi:CubicO group peptidase (beta-lactamase class C family)